VNAASETWEGGAWVVKSADGKVTATWDNTENKWVYNAENLQMIFGGVTLPNSKDGPDSEIPKFVNFVIPDAWKVPLSKDLIDSNPIVPLGIVGQHGDVTEFGVDFRGITLAEPAGDGYTTADRYVAGFTITDPNHPDILYTITVAIVNTPDYKAWFDLNPNGVTDPHLGIFVDPNDPDLNHTMHVPDILTVLKDPATIGRRMVIDLDVPGTGTNTVYNDPENQVFIDDFSSGQMLSNIETTATVQSLRFPKDLNISLTKK
jgi:hypothetical protein